MNEDIISRQAAIDVIDKILPVDPMRNEYTQGITCGAALAMEYIKQLPSAQPEQTTQTNAPNTLNALDCISRQAAIDAIDVLKRNYPSSCFEDLCKAVDIAIKALSAQIELPVIPHETERKKIC